MRNYIAIIHKDADSDFGVSFPDFPGCITAGDTLDEARENALEALTLHVEGMLEDGDNIPSPSSLDEVMADPINREGVAFLVPAPVKNLRTVRVNITMPEDMLESIDLHAKAHGFTRSGFLVSAAKKVIREEIKA